MAEFPSPNNREEAAKKLAHHHAKDARRMQRIAMCAAFGAVAVVLCSVFFGKQILATTAFLLTQPAIGSLILMTVGGLALCGGVYAAWRAVRSITRSRNPHKGVLFSVNQRGLRIRWTRKRQTDWRPVNRKIGKKPPRDPQPK